MSKMYLNGIVYGGAELPSSYACELLFENTDWSIASGTSDVSHTYTLSKSIDNFDAVLVTGYMFNSSNENERNQIQTMYITRNDYYLRSKAGSIYTAFALQGTVVGVRRRIYFGFENATKLCVIDTRSQSGEEPKIYRVYGIKFGGYATHDYSTEEHVVGKWIDGSTLYEKTIVHHARNNVAEANVIIDSSIKHNSNCYVVYIEGIANYGQMNTTKGVPTDGNVYNMGTNKFYYGAPSTSTTSYNTPTVYAYNDGIHFMKYDTANANGCIVTVRYIKI